MSAHSEWSTLLPVSAKDSEREQNAKTFFFFFVYVTLARDVKQFYSKRLELLF